MTLIVEAGPGSWFVPSSQTPGAFYRVTHKPGESFTCSCPWGQRQFTRACRHQQAVVELVAGSVAS